MKKLLLLAVVLFICDNTVHCNVVTRCQRSMASSSILVCFLSVSQYSFIPLLALSLGVLIFGDAEMCRKSLTRMFVAKTVVFIKSFFSIQLFISREHFLEKYCFVVSLVPISLFSEMALLQIISEYY